MVTQKKDLNETKVIVYKKVVNNVNETKVNGNKKNNKMKRK